MLRNKIIKRIFKVFIKIIESDDEDQFIILTIQLLELLIKLCKSKKLVKNLSIEKIDKCTVIESENEINGKNIVVESDVDCDCENSGIDSDFERKKIERGDKIKTTIEDFSIVIGHLLFSSVYIDYHFY